MEDKAPLKRVMVLLCTPEPKFLLPGIAPIIVGTALGWSMTGELNLLLAILALVSIVLINAGSNMVNDYYDHLSGNDWFNNNPTDFGGGSRYIQNGIITPKQMITAGLICLTLGASVGLSIVVLTKSIFILMLGILGVAGGFFWTAPPFRICYRIPGEPHIFLVFGLLPVYGAYYLQTNTIDLLPLIPAFIIGSLIAMVALINSIPDREADRKANKKTFVVRFGVNGGVILFRALLGFSYFCSFFAIFMVPRLFGASLGHLATIPLGILLLRLAGTNKLSEKGYVLPNKLTILLHSLSGVCMAAGIILQRLLSGSN